jgi:hypothetical protein
MHKKALNPALKVNLPKFLSQIKILSHKEKDDWELTPKYNIGKKPGAY